MKRLLLLNYALAKAEKVTTAGVSNQTKSRRTKQPAFQFAESDLPLFHVLPPANEPSISSPDLRELVTGFHIAIPSRRRPQLNNAAEFYLTMLPALVQEAGGKLNYFNFLESLSFLASPPLAGTGLPDRAALVFAEWRASFPSAIVDPNALQAALHDLIVMRHTLNIRQEDGNWVLVSGVQKVDITFDWTLTDARMALSHAASAHVVSQPWAEAISEDNFKQWTAA